MAMAGFSRESQWYQSLPHEECTYTTTEVRIPMPDGVHLVADLHEPSNLPPGTRPYGLILVLGCYGRTGIMGLLNAVMFATRGYKVLFTSSRGTFGSEGTFVPGMSEADDSQAIVKWVRDQPWYPGKFATFGASYLGYTQWALLRNPPEDLAACIILAAPHDHAQHNWDNGVFRMDRIVWNYVLANQEDKTTQRPTNRTQLLGNAEKREEVMRAVPLFDAVETYFNGKAPYMHQFMTTTDIDDPYWRPVRHSSAFDRVNVPILLGSGWYDPFTYQTLEQYARLKDRGCKVDITIGPWTHVEACGLHSMPEVFDFLDEHLAGRKKGQRPNPVKIFVTGVEEWRHIPAWPPAAKAITFYLHGDKSLGRDLPDTDPSPATFIYDPHNPTPTIGGPLLSGGGKADDSAYTSRSDVLVYTTSPLADDVEVLGNPVVHLTHSTDIPYADLWIRLSEVDSNGVSRNISEVYRGLDAEREDTISLKLQDCAHVFKKNTSIRVIVAGGSFPLMARNLGMEGNRIMCKKMRQVTHTIRHEAGVSRLELPCVLKS